MPEYSLKFLSNVLHLYLASCCGSIHFNVHTESEKCTFEPLIHYIKTKTYKVCETCPPKNWPQLARFECMFFGEVYWITRNNSVVEAYLELTQVQCQAYNIKMDWEISIVKKLLFLYGEMDFYSHVSHVRYLLSNEAR